jgi:hypothetical protein
MGVVDASPFCPAEGQRRGVQTSRRAHPDRLKRAQARGLDVWLHFRVIFTDFTMFLPFPSPCTFSISRGGQGGLKTYFTTSSSSIHHMLGRLHLAKQYSGASITTTDLVWRTRCGVLGDYTGRVWRHVLKDLAQPLNDHVIFDFEAGHARRVFITCVMVPEGVASHQWLYPPLHEAEFQGIDLHGEREV